jgi:RHS repeat-associated protein
VTSRAAILLFFDNGRGDITELADPVTGAVVAHVECSPFGSRPRPSGGDSRPDHRERSERPVGSGNLLVSSGPLAAANPYRFSSKEHDATGFAYYGYRYYSPELGRWINRDPIGERGGVNLRAFCANAPALSIDPVGFREQRPPCNRCCLEEPLTVELLGIKDGKNARIGFEMKAKFKTTGTDAAGDRCRSFCCEFKQAVKGVFMRDGAEQSHKLHDGAGPILRSDVFQDDGYSRSYHPGHYPPSQPPGTFKGNDAPGDGPFKKGVDVTGTWLEFEGWIRDKCRGPFYNTVVGGKLSYGFEARGKSPKIKIKLTGVLSTAP